MIFEKNRGTAFLPHLTLGVFGLVIGLFAAANALSDERFDDHFRVSSTTFTNNGVLPISTIDDIVAGNVNGCSIDGSPGGNQSPEVSWKHAPWGTRSFAVAMFDVTASFTHWGMYNIPAGTTSLPMNAGVPGSTFGAQVYNDFYLAQYSGPCPPIGVTPYSHRYVVTVYALDEDLDLPQSANFPPYAETLWYALVRAAQEGHMLASASITGLYSATPP
jgi:Raf kinase inhibitor-like YbhB/YbcL family protein